jgi:hypothetical protein
LLRFFPGLAILKKKKKKKEKKAFSQSSNIQITINKVLWLDKRARASKQIN